MRHTLTDLALISFVCLCFWAVKFPDDGLALLDWGGQQASHVAKLIRS